QWQDKENQTRYTTEINVRDLIMLGSGSGGGGRGPDFDSESEGSRNRAPARSASRSGQASSESTFEDFPAALEDQDDDLPFSRRHQLLVRTRRENPRQHSFPRRLP